MIKGRYVRNGAVCVVAVAGLGVLLGACGGGDADADDSDAISGTIQMDEGFTVEGQPELPPYDELDADLENDPDYQRLQEYKAVPGRACTPATGQVMADMSIPEYGGARVRVYDETDRQIGAGTVSATGTTEAGGCQLTFTADLTRGADFYTIEIAGERAQEFSQRELEDLHFRVELAAGAS